MNAVGDESSPTCFVCGCSGYNKYSPFIAKCSSCGVFEHQYCMKKVLRDVPEDWKCYSCQQSKELPKFENVQAPDKFSEQVRHKKFDYGKVKYIAPEEVAFLASGAKAICRKTSNALNKWHKPRYQICGGTTSKRFQCVRPKEEPNSGKFGCPTPVHSSKGLSTAKKIKPNTFLIMKQEVNGNELAVVPQSSMVEDLAVEPLPDRRLMNLDKNLSKNNNYSGDSAECSETTSEARRHIQKAHWKGRFDIQETNWNVCFGVKARLLREWLSDKAYETSKRFPKALQLKFKPCERIWPKMFKLQPPEFTDIALYFHPSKDGMLVKGALLFSFGENRFAKSGHWVLHPQCIFTGFFFTEIVASLATTTFDQMGFEVTVDKDGLPYLWGVFCRSKLLSGRPLDLVPGRPQDVIMH